MKTASEAIEKLPDLVLSLDHRTQQIARAVLDIQAEWEGLKRAGGGRDDHAAELLKRLRLGLRDLSIFAGDCQEQLIQVIGDPFNKEGR